MSTQDPYSDTQGTGATGDSGTTGYDAANTTEPLSTTTGGAYLGEGNFSVGSTRSTGSTGSTRNTGGSRSQSGTGSSGSMSATDSTHVHAYDNSGGVTGSYGSGTGSTGRGGAGESIQEGAGEVMEKARETTSQVASQVREQAMTQFSSQKDRAVDVLGSLSTAVRRTSEQLRTDQQEPIANFTDRAAEQVDRLTTYLESHDLNDIVDEVQRTARRQPALFLGGAFALGLLAARFLKSSGDEARSGQYGGYNYGGYSGGYRNYDTYRGYGDRGYSGSQYEGQQYSGQQYGGRLGSGDTGGQSTGYRARSELDYTSGVEGSWRDTNG